MMNLKGKASIAILVMVAFLSGVYFTTAGANIFGVEDRPITATVPKPKVGLPTERHAEVGYEAWTGGIDLLKEIRDDEQLQDVPFVFITVDPNLEMRRTAARTGIHGFLVKPFSMDDLMTTVQDMFRRQ